ncbi:hypothetical protein [Corallococcus macrosporus]|uniref:Uncharacterized protein n=1 Tax=Corallococcus macrosporus DSM 14697 TaxID=1189310 RepID=A0A250JYP0_9BACT|nr:hypothetical protein [Corallococcus macrosporus]ATB48808.1 hypothetical protein MYMAC_004439 [Corallococcus macrosporus DSM 14697]
MVFEILIGAVVMTLITVLFTGPGMWSSTWGYRNREGQHHTSKQPEAKKKQEP